MMDYQLNCQCVILLMLFGRTVSVQFHVLGPAKPIVAVTGDDIVLPCFLKPSISAVDFRVKWNLLNTVVHHYQQRTDQYNTQNPSFRGRTSLFKEELQTGNTSLKLTGVKLTDEGRYKCFVQSQDWFEDVFMEVIVQAVGSQPEIKVEGNLEGGFTLMCESKGWYPKPEVVWQDGEGKTFPTEPPETHQDSEGFYTVKLSVAVQEGDHLNIFICKVQQQQTSQVKMTEIQIPDEMFRLYNPWKTAVIVLSVLSAIIVIVLSSVLWLYAKARKLKSKAFRERGGAFRERDEAYRQRDKAYGERDKADLKTIRGLYAVNDVTFDQQTTTLDISEHGKRAKNNHANLNNWSTVLGKKFTERGNFYYLLLMTGAHNCDVGIMRGHNNNCEDPENHIFSVKLKEGDYMVGVYVRIFVSGGSVSVYNTETNKKMYSCTWGNDDENDTNKSIYPFFRLSNGNKEMCISNLEIYREIERENNEREEIPSPQPINRPDGQDMVELQPINDTEEEEETLELHPIKPRATNSELEHLINQREDTL